MAYNFFAPKPGRLGVLPTLLVGNCDATIAGTGTTSYNFGGHPARCYINRAVISALIVPVSASGTVLGVLQKYDASANAAVALTGNIDLEGLTANEGTAVSLLSTLTDAERTLDEGDTLRLVVTTTAAVGTAEEDLTVNFELLVLE